MRLLITTPDGQTREYVPRDGQGSITVGKRPGNDIVLDDPDVSNMHVRIERFLSRWTFADQFSDNGTFINGQRNSSGDLNDGDELKVGGTIIRLSAEGNPAAKADSWSLDSAPEPAAPPPAPARSEAQIRADYNLAQMEMGDLKPGDYDIVDGKLYRDGKPVEGVVGEVFAQEMERFQDERAERRREGQQKKKQKQQKQTQKQQPAAPSAPEEIAALNRVEERKRVHAASNQTKQAKHRKLATILFAVSAVPVVLGLAGLVFAFTVEIPEIPPDQAAQLARISTERVVAADVGEHIEALMAELRANRRNLSIGEIEAILAEVQQLLSENFDGNLVSVVEAEVTRFERAAEIAYRDGLAHLEREQARRGHLNEYRQVIQLIDEFQAGINASTTLTQMAVEGDLERRLFEIRTRMESENLAYLGNEFIRIHVDHLRVNDYRQVRNTYEELARNALLSDEQRTAMTALRDEYDALHQKQEAGEIPGPAAPTRVIPGTTPRTDFMPEGHRYASAAHNQLRNLAQQRWTDGQFANVDFNMLGHNARAVALEGDSSPNRYLVLIDWKVQDEPTLIVAGQITRTFDTLNARARLSLMEQLIDDSAELRVGAIHFAVENHLHDDAIRLALPFWQDEATRADITTYLVTRLHLSDGTFRVQDGTLVFVAD